MAVLVVVLEVDLPVMAVALAATGVVRLNAIGAAAALEVTLAMAARVDQVILEVMVLAAVAAAVKEQRKTLIEAAVAAGV